MSEQANKAQPIGAIILAAGASTRMGTPKQLLRYQQQSFLSHTTSVALESVCRPVIVVLGAYAQQIRIQVSKFPVQIVENFYWTQGMSSSIRAGLAALTTQPNSSKAVVFLLCDQPFISAQLLDQLVQLYQITSKPIVASEYAGVLGVPALFELFPELLSLKGQQGAKQVINKHAPEVCPVAFPQGTIDIDTPEDYRDFQQRFCLKPEDIRAQAEQY